MPILKSRDTNISDSVKVTFHVIGEYTHNVFTNVTTVQVFGFVSAEDALAGKAPFYNESFRLTSVNADLAIEESSLGQTIKSLIQSQIEQAIVREVSLFKDAQIV